MARIWSRCPKALRRGITGNRAESEGIRGNGSGWVAPGAVLTVLCLGILLLSSGQEAWGSRGTVQARARVVHRCAPAEIERARSEFRDFRARLAEPGSDDSGQRWRALFAEFAERREFDGGRLGVRVDTPSTRPVLTVEALAN